MHYGDILTTLVLLNCRPRIKLKCKEIRIFISHFVYLCRKTVFNIFQLVVYYPSKLILRFLIEVQFEDISIRLNMNMKRRFI